MGKKKASIIVLMLVLLTIGMLSLAFNIQPAKSEWTGTVYIRADGSIDPPDAPISTVDYVTYTLTGNITSDADGIVVERSNIIIDGAGYTIQGVYPGSKGMNLTSVINVTIKNVNIENFNFAGVYLDHSSNSSIIGNNITANKNLGIYLKDSSNNSIAENNVTGNYNYGIFLSYSPSNNITGNNITDNGGGVYLGDSSNSNITGNTFSHGNGLTVSNSYGNVVVDNLVNSKPLVYLEGFSDMAIVEDAGQVILVNCSRIRVENLNISGTDTGIELWKTDNTIISSNNITNNGVGIEVWHSSNNTISGNNITRNDGATFLFYSSGSTLYANNITNNSGDYTVYLDSSSNNIIKQNILINNRANPMIYLEGSSYNTFANNVLNVYPSPKGIWVSGSYNVITGNTITNASEMAILLKAGSDNQIYGNTIKNNTKGIAITSSSNNVVYHNNFVNNHQQVYDFAWTYPEYYSPSINVWDDGYLGNYWSDYDGTDANGDGIGDTPYVIDENNRDRYPLMGPWPPTHELVVSITAPLFLKPGSLSMLKATVTNEGANDETNVELSLLINDTIADSVTIPVLQSSSSYTLNYSWTPTAEGIYNITAYTHSVPGEISIGNNRASKFVTVSAIIIVPDNYPTIQAAINAADLGDTIFVKKGTYYEHVIIDKSIALIGEDRDRTIIDGSSTGTVVNITANYVNVTGFTVQNSGDHYDHGIYVFSSFCNITYNIVKNCRYGIKLDNSTDIIISENMMTANSFVAIKMDGSSRNTLSRNNITSNRYGIGLDYSLNNTISGNNITNNNEGGIGLYRSPNNVISLNNITNNRIGIDIPDYPSTNNTIYGNNITNNEYGITLIGSGNKIYHNNFINNTQQAYFMLGSTQPNVWDDGYSGNFWSDYTGVDANGDGIGDTPYIINANNKDRYPLMNLWTPSWVPPEHAPPTPPEVQVGVKAGDWIKVEYTITGWPSGQPYPKWLKVEFLSVEGTNVTVRVTMHMSNGTEQNATVPVIIGAGGGEAFGLSGFVIPTNLTAGDSVYISGYGNITIEGETTRTYAGASRTVVYASFSQYGTQLTYYWDKQTGVMVEASTTSGSVTATAKATETNMWQPAPSGFPIEPIYIIAIAIIIIIIVAAILLIRKRKT